MVSAPDTAALQRLEHMSMQAVDAKASARGQGAAALPAAPATPTDKIDALLVPVREGFLVTSTVYNCSFRTTHSDVMITTNTTQVVTSDAGRSTDERRNAELRRIQCRFPYKETSPFKEMGEAPLSTHFDVDAHLRKKQIRNRELLEEKDKFLADMEEERLSKTRSENLAATKMQASFRGWRERPHPEYTRKRPLVLNQAELAHEIQTRSQEAGLAPIRGVTLGGAKPRMKVPKGFRSRKEWERHSAITIQSQGRVWLARRRMARKRAVIEDKEQRHMATKLQSLVRGRQGRQEAERIQRERENQAAQVLQSRVRGMASRFEVAHLKRRQEEMQRQSEAARMIQTRARVKFATKKREEMEVVRMGEAVVRIQAQLRAKRDRKLVAKKRVEKEEQAFAATLIQSRIRAAKAREEVKVKRQEQHGATKIQNTFRTRKARRELEKRNQAVGKIHAAALGRRDRARVRAIKQERVEQNNAATLLQARMRGANDRAIVRNRRMQIIKDHSALLIQTASRKMIAKNRVKKMRMARINEIEQFVDQDGAILVHERGVAAIDAGHVVGVSRDADDAGVLLARRQAMMQGDSYQGDSFRSEGSEPELPDHILQTITAQISDDPFAESDDDSVLHEVAGPAVRM